jgi:hypothetical protein
VREAAWAESHHASKVIHTDQITLAHTPTPTEIFAFAGFAGERTSFHFDSLFCKTTVSLSREVKLPEDERWNSRFHFGLDYRPDLATSVVGNEGLPRPPGLSGSAVWNTCFVEAKAKGINCCSPCRDSCWARWSLPPWQGAVRSSADAGIAINCTKGPIESQGSNDDET